MTRGVGPQALVVIPAEALADLVTTAVAAAIATPQTTVLPALLDRVHLAQTLGVSTSTVDRLVRTGLPYLLVAEAKRFELDSVMAWLRQREEAP